jgi:hypothetical protein
MARYLSGLSVAGLGLCAGGWLIVTAVLLSGESTDASLVSLSTGAGLALVSVVGIACWSVAWRQRMRRDGVLGVVACPVPGGRPVSAGGPVSAGSPVPAASVLSAGGPGPAGKARRSPRVLRRDMRRAARAARRQARRRGAGSMGTIAYGGSAARHESAAKRAAAAQRVAAAQQDSAGSEPIFPPAAMPQDPALLLTEIRALLEPLLAAHDAALPGTAQDTMPDKRPAPPDMPAPSRTPAVAPREAPAPLPVPAPRSAVPLAGACPLVTGDGEESW